MSKQFLTPIVLPADPTAALEAATKQYVDAKAYGALTVLNDPNLNTITTPGTYLVHKVSTGPTNAPPGATVPTDMLLMVQASTSPDWVFQTLVVVTGDEVWQRTRQTGIWLQPWTPINARPPNQTVDLNTLVNNGVYYVTGAGANVPLAETAMLVVDRIVSNQPSCTQEWVSLSSGKRYWRYRNQSSVWSTWAREDLDPLPRGVIGYVPKPPTPPNAGGSNDVVIATNTANVVMRSLTVPLVAGRLYKVCAAVRANVLQANCFSRIVVAIGSNLADGTTFIVDGYGNNNATVAGGYMHHHHERLYAPPATVSQLFTMAGTYTGSSGNVTMHDARMWVEDVGLA